MIDQFLNYMRYEKGRSELTAQEYERTLKGFQSYFEQREIGLSWSLVDADLVRDWMEFQMDRGVKASTVNKNLSVLRSFYRYALRVGLVTVDPIAKVKGPKREKPLPQFVKESEMDLLLEKDKWTESFKDIRARTILILLYETGMRLAELTGLDDADIDFHASHLKVTGKRNKQRVIPFGERIATDLKDYVEVRNKEVGRMTTAFFVDDNGQRMASWKVYYIVRKNLGLVTTLKKRSPHVLRHTFATAMLNNGANIESVQKLLGHASVGTTEIYTHTTFEQLKQAYKKAHPRG